MNQNTNFSNASKGNNIRNEENSKLFQIAKNSILRTTMNKDVKYDQFRKLRNIEFIASASLSNNKIIINFIQIINIRKLKQLK